MMSILGMSILQNHRNDHPDQSKPNQNRPEPTRLDVVGLVTLTNWTSDSEVYIGRFMEPYDLSPLSLSPWLHGCECPPATMIGVEKGIHSRLHNHPQLEHFCVELASSFSVVARLQCYKHKSSFYMGAVVACLGNKRNFSSSTSVPVFGGPNASSHAPNNSSRSLGAGFLKYTSGETYSVLQAGCLQHWFKNWQTLRKHKLTASTFAGAIGFWPRRRVQLWLEKLGAIEPFSGNLATCWSNIKEEEALERYKLITGNTVLFPEFQVYGRNPQDDWLAASPDGIVDRLVYELPSHGVLEIKCPYFNGDMSKAFPWSRIPIHYIPQAQGLMEILGRDWMDFYVWTPNGSSLFRLHRDAEYWHVMKMALSDFWWKHVQPARELYSSNVITNPLFQLRSLRPASRHELCSYIVCESKHIVYNSKLLMREIHGKLHN